ncbi:MFS transporter [Rossellomorea sp. AcN35-11]|nr:MFS transporter [Rossellomorea sp. AcN35-11]
MVTGIGITFFLLFISTFQWYYFAGAILSLGGLWVRIQKIDLPFIQPGLIRDKGYRQLLYMSFLGFATHFAILIVMPLMLQHVFGRNPTAVGFIIFPGAMLSAVAAIYVGRLIDRYGNMRVMFLAHLLLIISTIIFYFLSPQSEYMIMLAYMFTSFGFSSLSSSTTNEVSRVMSKELIASGIGMKQLTHFVGSASGSVLGGIIVEMGGADFAVHSFQHTFLVLIGIMLLSLFLLCLYKKRITHH